jgi:SAM-dependent methyltransferase
MSPDENPWTQSRRMSGDAYDARYEADAAAGKDVHGEADFVVSYAPRSVLDAGCGTGRVGRELARRGIDVVGVDIDPEMLGTARRKAAEIEWHLADLATVELGRTFDIAVAAGNVMIFLSGGTESAVIANIARHLGAGGLLIAGFQLGHGMPLDRYDELCAAAGLELRERFATWDKDPGSPGGDYAVSVHARADVAG